MCAPFDRCGGPAAHIRTCTTRDRGLRVVDGDGREADGGEEAGATASYVLARRAKAVAEHADGPQFVGRLRQLKHAASHGRFAGSGGARARDRAVRSRSHALSRIPPTRASSCCNIPGTLPHLNRRSYPREGRSRSCAQSATRRGARSCSGCSSERSSRSARCGNRLCASSDAVRTASTIRNGRLVSSRFSALGAGSPPGDSGQAASDHFTSRLLGRETAGSR